jgi:hypothetical protein
MKISLKKTLLFLILLNLYLFSFFIWYRPVIFSSRFVDTYESLPDTNTGPAPVTVFIPCVEYGKIDEPAGIISRTISYCYLPMVLIWEKRGVGVFCIDQRSLLELMDKEGVEDE